MPLSLVEVTLLLQMTHGWHIAFMCRIKGYFNAVGCAVAVAPLQLLLPLQTVLA